MSNENVNQCMLVRQQCPILLYDHNATFLEVTFVLESISFPLNRQ